MEKFIRLSLLCKASVSITVNQHKDFYETAEKYLSDNADDDDVTPEVRKKMIELDRIVDVHFYPHTPIGFYTVYHWDVDAAMDEALKIAQEVCE